MACPNSCSGNYGMGSLTNPCNVPLTSPIALCSANVSRGEVLCLPSSCHDHAWLMDNCQETCGEPASCPPQNCEPSSCEASSCPSPAFYGPRPCQGTCFLPVASYISSSCLPVSCRPLSYVHSGCRPLSLLPYGCRPSGWMPCGPQPLRVVSSGLGPLRPLLSGCQPLTQVLSPCRPSCFALGGQ